jgi:uroporphyrinogen decarboxylase
VIVMEKTGITSISTEIDHTLRDRRSWEEIFKPRLEFTPERIRQARAGMGELSVRLAEGYDHGIEVLRRHASQEPVALHCGSLLGVIRDWLGLVGLSYLIADDPGLLDEMIETVAELMVQGVSAALATGAQFDYALFWEDMAYKAGPLVSPRIFRDKLGPHYRRITDVLHRHGITIVSLDCDGVIDKLIPTWLENGVNTMFPIEVGTWNASIAPWRERFGRELRGVGGVDKRIFGRDRPAVESEIERQRALVGLGGYLPCPDHRIPGDAKWELVQYYCERMREVFG